MPSIPSLSSLIGEVIFHLDEARFAGTFPFWPVASLPFKTARIYVTSLESSFSMIFVSFSLSALCSGTVVKLPVKSLLWETVVWHSDDVAYPA